MALHTLNLLSLLTALLITLHLATAAPIDADINNTTSLAIRSDKVGNPTGYTYSSHTVLDGSATGECWWDFVSATKIDRIHCAVEDTKTDGHNVYAYLWVSDGWNFYKMGEVRTSKGKGEKKVDTVFHSKTHEPVIRWAAVLVGVDFQFSLDYTQSGDTFKNPHCKGNVYTCTA